MGQVEVVERTLTPPRGGRCGDPELGCDYFLCLAAKNAHEDRGVIRAQAAVCAIEVGDKVHPVASAAFAPGSQAPARQVFPDAGKHVGRCACLGGVRCGLRKPVVRVTGRPPIQQADRGSYDGRRVPRRGILCCNGYLANRGHGCALLAHRSTAEPGTMHDGWPTVHNHFSRSLSATDLERRA
jgi:hypothetical protein